MLIFLFLNSKLVRILIKANLVWQFDASLLELQGSLQSNYKDTDDKFNMLRKRLSNDQSKGFVLSGRPWTHVCLWGMLGL